MNRIEAKHILDAYKLTVDLYGDDTEEAKALQNVILDAMTIKTINPYITIPNSNLWPYPQVTYSTNIEGK